MDQNQAQQIDQHVRRNWNQVRSQILNQFAQVSTADLDAARNPQDLVERIADKTHHSERFVETRLTELVSVGGSQQGNQPGSQSYGSQQGNQSDQPSSQQGERYGSSQPQQQ